MTIFCVSFLAIMQELENELVNTVQVHHREYRMEPLVIKQAVLGTNGLQLRIPSLQGVLSFTDSRRALESPVPNLSFFNSFYFVVVTITSVGHGDIKPSRTLKIFVIIFVVAFFLVIPMSI